MLIVSRTGDSRLPLLKCAKQETGRNGDETKLSEI